MKKLNITKKQYNESKFFTKKYGALKYVSESGKLFKTDKGVVLALESADEDEPAGPIDDLGPAGDGDGDGDGDGEEEVTVKKEDLATALQGVIDTVKDIAADNDVTLPEEEEDGEGEPEGDVDDDEEEDLDDLEFDEDGKGGVHYNPYEAICLEAQMFPDAIHHENFASAVIDKDEVKGFLCGYRFSVK